MKLITLPDEGLAPVISAIKQATKSIDILIFRLDRNEITHALEAANARGVRVRALTAHQNRGGTKSLRRLEMQLLEGGVTVSRTAADLVRYHGKMMIVDGKILHVYGFNFTALDVAKSRSFGVITRNKKLVGEAIKLFEADFERQPYCSGSERFIVSPDNARDRLAKFLKGARKQLLIYDPKACDDAMMRILLDRIKDDVEVKILGKVEGKWGIEHERFPGRRLHVRAIIRDGQRAFIGSQSLRRLELEKRREIGVIIDDEDIIAQMTKVFAEDWAQTPTGKKEAKKARRELKKSEVKSLKSERSAKSERKRSKSDRAA